MTSQENYQKNSLDLIFAVRLIISGAVLLPSMYFVWHQSIYTFNMVILFATILLVMAMSSLYFLTGIRTNSDRRLSCGQITLFIDPLLLMVLIVGIEPQYGTYLYGIYAFYIVGGGAVCRGINYLVYVVYAIACCGGLWVISYAPLFGPDTLLLKEVNLGVLTLIMAVVAASIWALNREINKIMVHVSMGEYAADAVHEMKTPLSTLLIMSDQNVEDHRARDLMKQEIERISTFLNNYEYLGIQIEANPRNVPVGALVKSSIATIKSISGAKEIDFRITVESQKLVAYIDEEHGRSIFENILKNATEAIREKGEIEVIISENSFEWIKVEIKDTGTGVEEEERKKVFETFYTTKGTRGLGLAIVKKLITENKGRVQVESGPKSGAVFTVFLPRPEEDF